MRQVRSRHTSPEVRLRKALWRAGLRYRLCTALPGKPDFVLPGHHTVVFVDGDFWHGNQWRLRGFSSLAEQMACLSGGDYWIAKIDRNVARDRRVDAQLGRAGWRVLRFWESEVNADLDTCVQRVLMAIREVAA